MNDFTKEELQTMLTVMDDMYFGRFYANKSVPPLYEKIQKMLDNYCAHSPIIIIRNDGTTIQCYKCGKEYTGE